jgi:hypothetical protein
MLGIYNVAGHYIESVHFKKNDNYRTECAHNNNHTLQGLRFHLCLFILRVLNLLAASNCSNDKWIRNGSEKSGGQEVASLLYYFLMPV